MTDPTQTEQRRNPQARAVGSGMLLAGVGFVLFWEAIVWSTTWPDITAYIALNRARQEYGRTQATVLSSEVITNQVHYGKSGAPTTTYRPEIRYRYRVNGVAYESTTRHFGGDVDTRPANEAVDTVGDHPRGSTLEVYYDPKAPNVAMWDTTFPRRRQKQVIRGAVMSVFGLFFLAAIVGFRRMWLKAAASGPAVHGQGGTADVGGSR